MGAIYYDAYFDAPFANSADTSIDSVCFLPQLSMAAALVYDKLVLISHVIFKIVLVAKL